MRRSRRDQIPQRRRVFVGCEGESERGYVRLISRLTEERHRRVHLDPVILGGGDPLASVEAALRQLRIRVGRGGAYAKRVIFLDADRRKLALVRSIRAEELAARLDIQMIWQEPCHEALLLRHLPNCWRLRPSTPRLAMADLRRRWPEYEKAMPAARLATRLNREAVLRAAKVDDSLRAFLEAIHFGGIAE